MRGRVDSVQSTTERGVLCATGDEPREPDAADAAESGARLPPQRHVRDRLPLPELPGVVGRPLRVITVRLPTGGPARPVQRRMRRPST